jgi:LmbE family N-acetylglucosaminyl deacetylase
MLRLTFNRNENKLKTILCLGAHSDDIEIGCGGSILRLLEENQNTEVYWIVFSADSKRKKEAESSADLFLAGAKKREIRVKNFRESFFPYIGADIKEYFEELKQQISPDLIFTPFREDLHQDHRLVAELTWNTFRDDLILEYEVVKYDGDLGSPNFFVPLNEPTCRKKIETIFKCFKTQGSRGWFTEDVFSSIMRIRGVECNAPDKFAEAFYCRKMVF